MQKKNTRPNRERKKEKNKMIDIGEKQNTEKGLEYKKKRNVRNHKKKDKKIIDQRYFDGILYENRRAEERSSEIDK